MSVPVDLRSKGMAPPPTAEGPRANGLAEPPNAGADRPNRRKRLTTEQVVESVGSALAAVALVWIVFTVTGVSGPFGFAVASICVFFVIYGVVCWRAHGILSMKDRLATVAIWIGALLRHDPAGAVIAYVIFKGAAVALAQFPPLLRGRHVPAHGQFADDRGGRRCRHRRNDRAGGHRHRAHGPSRDPHRHLSGRLRDPCSPGWSSYVVDAMTGAPAIIAGLFVYLFWVAPRHHNGKSGLAAGMALAVMMLPVVTRAAQEVVAIVPGSLREAALALGAPQWRVLVRVVLPTARAGLMTAVILGVARIAGETAPVLFNAGGNDSLQLEPVRGPAGQSSVPDLPAHPATQRRREPGSHGVSPLSWSSWSSPVRHGPAGGRIAARPPPDPSLRATQQ